MAPVPAPEPSGSRRRDLLAGCRALGPSRWAALLRLRGFAPSRPGCTEERPPHPGSGGARPGDRRVGRNRPICGFERTGGCRLKRVQRPADQEDPPILCSGVCHVATTTATAGVGRDPRPGSIHAPIPQPGRPGATGAPSSPHGRRRAGLGPGSARASANRDSSRSPLEGGRRGWRGHRLGPQRSGDGHRYFPPPRGRSQRTLGAARSLDRPRRQSGSSTCGSRGPVAPFAPRVGPPGRRSRSPGMGKNPEIRLTRLRRVGSEQESP